MNGTLVALGKTRSFSGQLKSSEEEYQPDKGALLAMVFCNDTGMYEKFFRTRNLASSLTEKRMAKEAPRESNV